MTRRTPSISTIAWAILLAVVLAPGCGKETSQGPEPPADDDIPPQTTAIHPFADTRLDSAVRQALDRPEEDLTREQLLSVTRLTARNQGIADLGGIEQLENLTILDLADNRIRDITPLGSLTRLTFLDLSRNRIEDITPLIFLTDLEILGLAGNHVRDIAPLLELEELTSLELTGCPLDDASRQVHLPALEDRGVEATFRLEAGEGDAVPVEMPDFEIVFIGKGRNERTDVFRMKTDGSEPVNLTDSPAYDCYSLTYTPDGKRIAYVEGGSLQFFYIYSMDLESGNVMQLTLKSGRENTFRHLTWSPDGRHIALVKFYSFPSQDRYYTEIGVVGTDGSGYADLTQTAQNEVFHSDPTWSPDGGRVAFTRYSFAGEEYTHDLYVMDADGSQPFRLVEWGLSPAWSPDGERIAYVRMDRDDPGISLIDSERGTPVSLTWYWDSRPAWSPDGGWIAFAREDGDIYAMSADGGLPFNLTQDPFREGEPAWSPDGRWIGFLRDGDIWAVPAAGGETVNLTNHFQKPIYEFRWVP